MECSLHWIGHVMSCPDKNVNVHKSHNLVVQFGIFESYNHGDHEWHKPQELMVIHPDWKQNCTTKTRIPLWRNSNLLTIKFPLVPWHFGDVNLPMCTQIQFIWLVYNCILVIFRLCPITLHNSTMSYHSWNPHGHLTRAIWYENYREKKTQSRWSTLI